MGPNIFVKQGVSSFLLPGKRVLHVFSFLSVSFYVSLVEFIVAFFPFVGILGIYFYCFQK